VMRNCMLITSSAQILDMDPEAEEGATKDVDSSKKSKCAVIKTSTRQVRAKVKDSIHAVNTTIDHLPSYHWTCPCLRTQAWRSHRCQQRFVSCPRHITGGI
jgi:hypothetical protein